jgi:hypothetical protein
MGSDEFFVPEPATADAIGDVCSDQPRDAQRLRIMAPEYLAIMRFFLSFLKIFTLAIVIKVVPA